MQKLFILALFTTIGHCCFAQPKWNIIKQELLFEAPPFKECHASTIIEVLPGKLLAAYFAGTGEGDKDVGIWLSEQNNGVVNGVINDTLRYPCWNPVLFRPRSGHLQLYYKVGPSPREWWGMVVSSPDHGKTWSKAQRLPDGILGPIKNKPVQLADGTIVSPSSTETSKHWKVHMECSTDNAKTWQVMPVDTASNWQVIQPTILTYSGNKLQILCRSKSDRIVQAFSYDKGRTWTPMSTLSLLNPNAGIDAVTLNNGWQLLVYNPTTRGKEWMNGRGKLNVAISKDGTHWNDVAVLEDGEDQPEYSYPAVIQAANGRVHITYTYDRKNIKHVVMEEQR